MESYRNDNLLEETSEMYNNNKFYDLYSKTRSWIITLIGVIFTVLGIALIFIIASLEGTREVKASNSVGGKILNIWREENELPKGFPEEKSDIIIYKDKEYYFVVDKYNEEGEVLKWHFAYDGGLEYIFSDYKFYVLTTLTLVISIAVSYINYKSTIKSEMQRPKFAKTLNYYQTRKVEASKYYQYVPNFCIDKNHQVYEIAKRDIIESANINYEWYMSDKYDKNKLEKWQRKKLKEIKKIKIKRIHTSDLLQEHGTSTTRIELLPMGQVEHQKKFLISGIFQKFFSSALSGLTVSFGVVLGNWVLGVTYGMTVAIGAVTAVVVATDFTNTTLRNRYLAKGDLLGEFCNIKDKYIMQEQQKLEQLRKEEQLKQEQQRLEQLKQEQQLIQEQQVTKNVVKEDESTNPSVEKDNLLTQDLNEGFKEEYVGEGI